MKRNNPLNTPKIPLAQVSEGNFFMEDYSEQRREIGKELKEKKRLVDDMKQ